MRIGYSRFSISIFFICVSVIFLPIWQVLKSHKLKHETLEAIAQWEHKNERISHDLESMSNGSATASNSNTLVNGSIAAKSELSGKTKGSESSDTSRKSDLFTMQALENALRSNPLPLLEYAALKDFSGENISFLSHVSDWKKVWPLAGPGDTHDQFIHAVRIYSHFVSLDYADFPVNISSGVAKGLRALFGEAAILLNRRSSLQSDSATPFDEIAPTESTANLRSGSDHLENNLGKANLNSATHMTELTKDGRMDIPIPAEFNPYVFDTAEKEIKYLVLTNTWPKFVHARFETALPSPTQEHRFRFHPGQLVCGWKTIV